MGTVTPALSGLSGLSGQVNGSGIRITDANAGANQVSEDAAVGTAVGITAQSNSLATPIVYSLDDDAGGLFTINSSTGVVTTDASLNAETGQSKTIVVRATDNNAEFKTRSFVITILDVDEFNVGAVTDADGSANTVPENSAIGTVVGVTATATDADITDDVTYSLTDDAGGRFAIHPTTGVVTVAGSINREDAASYNITVRATSDDGSTSDETFSIAVTDVNEFAVGAVTDSNADANEVRETASNGATVGITAAATDADATNNTITFSLDDDAGGRFAIHSSTGVVTVADAASIVYANDTSHTITVRATSSDGSASTADFTIAVLEVTFTGPNEFDSLIQYALDGGEAYDTIEDELVLRPLETHGTDRLPRQGRCYLFDGVDDYAVTPNPTITNTFTLTAWVNLDVNTTQKTIIGFSDAVSANPPAIFRTNNGKANLYLRTSTAVQVTGGTTITTGVWYNIASVYNGSDMRIYVNGAIDATPVAQTGDIASINNSKIGSWLLNGSNSQFMDGKLRDVRIYNVAKDATAIAAIAAGDQDTTGLVAQYHCNEESGTVAYDASGNGNHGTITNATLSTFHATDTAITSNPNNETGYRLSGSVYIPKRLSDSLAADGNALTQTGKAPNPAKVEVPCLTLDGTDDRLTLASPLTISGQFTISFWINPDVNATQVISGRSDNSNASIIYNSVSGNIIVETNTASSSAFSTALTVGSWQHILITRSSVNSITVYKNGVSVGSQTVTGTWQIGQIGAQNGISPSLFFNGKLEDFRVFDTSKDSTEALAIYNGEDTGNLLFHLPMQEGDGTTIYDVSGNSNHGTLLNATLLDAWANRTSVVKDHCIKYGGRVDADIFIPGNLTGSNAANGTAKTLTAGKFGNPYSRINFNPFAAAELNGTGSETAYAKTTARQSVSPTDTKFRRTAADGDDRFFTTADALTGDDKTNAESYVS